MPLKILILIIFFLICYWVDKISLLKNLSRKIPELLCLKAVSILIQILWSKTYGKEKLLDLKGIIDALIFALLMLGIKFLFKNMKKIVARIQNLLSKKEETIITLPHLSLHGNNINEKVISELVKQLSNVKVAKVNRPRGLCAFAGHYKQEPYRLFF